MKKYKFIFIVLVYKNVEVLKDFFKEFQIDNAHVVVVNSFYDEITRKECMEVALNYCASFINIPNKGYSYGNNVGVEYAINNFDFDFLVISNSDIIIKEWADLSVFKGKPYVIAPQTVMRNHKHQNPNIPIFSKCLYYNLLRKGYKLNNRILVRTAHAFSRLTRELYLIGLRLMGSWGMKIFSAHGSFIIFTKEAVKLLNPIFNNEMFLYNEELYLAFRCRELKIPIFYNRNIKIIHLEGASSIGVNNLENKKSFMILDEYVKQHNLLNL